MVERPLYFLDDLPEITSALLLETIPIYQRVFHNSMTTFSQAVCFFMSYLFDIFLLGSSGSSSTPWMNSIHPPEEPRMVCRWNGGSLEQHLRIQRLSHPKMNLQPLYLLFPLFC